MIVVSVRALSPCDRIFKPNKEKAKAKDISTTKSQQNQANSNHEEKTIQY